MTAISACLVFCCIILISGVSVAHGISPATYSAAAGSLCSQNHSIQEETLMNTLTQLNDQLGPPGCNPPKKQIPSENSSLLPINLLWLLPDTCYQWIPSGCLL